MSNAIHRIVSNAMLFALLISVSLPTFAHDNNTSTDVVPPTPYYIVCDTSEQTNLDVDIDLHVNGFSIRVLQPLPDNTQSLYVNISLTQPFKHAYQRGPPSYFI